MVDTEGTAYPVCPHCGNIHYNDFEYDDGVYNCAQCGEEFEVEREVSVSFTTRKKSIKCGK